MNAAAARSQERVEFFVLDIQTTRAERMEQRDKPTLAVTGRVVGRIAGA